MFKFYIIRIIRIAGTSSIILIISESMMVLQSNCSWLLTVWKLFFILIICLRLSFTAFLRLSFNIYYFFLTFLNKFCTKHIHCSNFLPLLISFLLIFLFCMILNNKLISFRLFLESIVIWKFILRFKKKVIWNIYFFCLLFILYLFHHQNHLLFRMHFINIFLLFTQRVFYISKLLKQWLILSQPKLILFFLFLK
jgi:hypothetical protein